MAGTWTRDHCTAVVACKYLFGETQEYTIVYRMASSEFTRADEKYKGDLVWSQPLVHQK